MQLLSKYTTHPLTHQLLTALLKDYKRPNDKIHEWLKNGSLLSIKKGLYIAGPAIPGNKPEPFLLANHIWGPSYVSVDAALSHYGLIPERVYEITSMTTKVSKKFATPAGVFNYIHLPLPYYAFGISQLRFPDNQCSMIASPEKSLFDKIVTTSGLILRSAKNVHQYLIEDLRIDEQDLRNLDTNMMLEWINNTPKKQSLELLIKTLKTL